MAISILILENVPYQYEGSRKPFLDNINVAFKPGKVYTIVVKSGTGKPILLSLIAELNVCSGRKILHEGTSLNTSPGINAGEKVPQPMSLSAARMEKEA